MLKSTNYRKLSWQIGNAKKKTKKIHARVDVKVCFFFITKSHAISPVIAFNMASFITQNFSYALNFCNFLKHKNGEMAGLLILDFLDSGKRSLLMLNLSSESHILRIIYGKKFEGKN